MATDGPARWAVCLLFLLVGCQFKLEGEYDPFRCDPACPGGNVCLQGHCIGVVVNIQLAAGTEMSEAIQVYQIHVLHGSTKGGEPLSCSKMPGTYREDSPEVICVVDPPPTVPRPKDSNNPVQLQTVVPAGNDLVFSVLGLAAYKGTQVVARGCKETQELKKEPSVVFLVVDMRPTTGAPCTTADDCERNLTCVSGPGFDEGYCAVRGCSEGGTCPPGAACIYAPDHGDLCLGLCQDSSDCHPASVQYYSQSCVGRLSAAGSCETVCVEPVWNESYCCGPDPSACGSSDGGP
jgi:hypothetical protein